MTIVLEDAGKRLPIVTDAPSSDRVVIGRVSGVFGTRGWIKIYSYTRPRENIITFRDWFLKIGGEWRKYRVKEAKRHGAGLIAALVEVDDRDAAVALVHSDIAVSRGAFPDEEEGEYYWADLVGLDVVNLSGTDLGAVTRLLDTGANDVLVVSRDGRERLIPYVPEVYVVEVRLDEGRILVDWHEDD